MFYFSLFCAGGAGVLVRYFIVRLLDANIHASFSLGVLLCNLIGSFLIGYLSWMMMSRWFFSNESQLVIMLAFLGGFTTFSAFSLDLVSLLEAGENFTALLYTCASVVGSPLLCFMGLLLARQTIST